MYKYLVALWEGYISSYNSIIKQCPEQNIVYGRIYNLIRENTNHLQTTD